MRTTKKFEKCEAAGANRCPRKIGLTLEAGNLVECNSGRIFMDLTGYAKIT